ncbi:hypothetical protein PQX77_002517, partial [Marasmius sp. AFHP31]
MPPIWIGRNGKHLVQLSKTFKPSYPFEEDARSTRSSTNKSHKVKPDHDLVYLILAGKSVNLEEWEQQANQRRAALKRGEQIDEDTANAVAVWNEMERRDKQAWDSYVDLIEMMKRPQEDEEDEEVESREGEGEQKQMDSSLQSRSKVEENDEEGTRRKRSAAILPAASLLASKKRYGIIKSLIDPRKRRPRPKAPPIPQALKIIHRQKAQATRKAINDIVTKWEQDTRQLAEQMAGKYGRKVQYFLDLLFRGGVRLSKQQQRTNYFNTFKSVKAHDLCNKGITKTLLEITKEYKPEYERMSKPERLNIVKRYHELKESEKKGHNPTAKARAQNVTMSIDAIIRILEALSLQVGIDAFVCIVRNRTEDFIEPQWYFSNAAIEKYLSLITWSVPFNVREVGLKLQVFSIAGCDVMKLFMTDKEHVATLSSEIVDLVKEKLDSAAGWVVPHMFYQGFAQQITWNHGVVAANWPVPAFENPSKSTKDIWQLTAIRNTIRNDTEYPIFRKMSDSEWAEWKELYCQAPAAATGPSSPPRPRLRPKKTTQDQQPQQFNNSQSPHPPPMPDSCPTPSPDSPLRGALQAPNNQPEPAMDCDPSLPRTTAGMTCSPHALPPRSTSNTPSPTDKGHVEDCAAGIQSRGEKRVVKDNEGDDDGLPMKR